MWLSEVDPVEMARFTVDAAWHRIRAAARRIDSNAQVHYDNHDRLEETGLGKAVCELTLYAQHGQPFPKSAIPSPPLEVNEYCDLLRRIGDDAILTTGEPDPGTPLGAVVAAALAREALEHGKPVRATWLAELAGCSHVRIKQLVHDGTMRSSGRGLVRADDARRWLGARGVKVERRADT